MVSCPGTHCAEVFNWNNKIWIQTQFQLYEKNQLYDRVHAYNKNSAESVVALAGAKVTGATIRTWLLNKFISFLAVLSWKTGLKKNVDKVPSGTHIFQANAIPSNADGYIFSTDCSYYTAQW